MTESWQDRFTALMAEAHEHAKAAQEAFSRGEAREAYDHTIQVRRVAREAQELFLENL